MSALGAPPDVPLAQVKWRVDSRPFDGRARFLPYIDAYELARLLDAWVGPENWSDAYEPAHGKGLWCHLSIRVGETWVTKTDKGVPSNMESEKGEVSDAFKRAGSLKWGVGGNVYRLPNVWAPVTTKKSNSGEVAVPNKETIPAIIRELDRLGFKDAAVADATNDDHDEPQDREGGGALDPGGQRATDAAPAPASFDDHSFIRKEIAGLDADGKKRLADWWKQRRLPNIRDKDVLTAGEAEAVLSFLDELHEQRGDPGDLAARAERMRERAAEKSPEDRKRAASDPEEARTG